LAPDGSNDTVARRLQPIPQEQSISTVIENTPEANGVIGMRRFATNKPDGYTIGLNKVLNQ
jgi:tripartite-type tricarboxylate transporter receptor subunit TctC